eukprot:gnl/MRDRNA2_/MRDRNA2_90975_c0_seq1.p1 gnl/MRDRNA2_/MRDRNA2_90975_c0~~gnl/MRDRNA2_/MRDRNA2_90975_c0_seq1.p1  ORF type:complete len:1248 (-),score=283.39 gnl/MRDRNA2_/MRDRNA2_90975_c0_seq1:156-3665(-)
MFAKVVHSSFLVQIRHQEDLTSIEVLRQRATTLAGDLNRLITNANAPIFSLDRGGKVMEWNRKIAELTNIRADKAVGCDVRDLVANKGTCGKELDKWLQETLAGHDTSPIELEMMGISTSKDHDHDAKSAIVVVSATPAQNEDGSVVGLFCVGQDLTEVAALKRAEQKQLDFMAVVSHELRSPLHGIIGLASNLAESEKVPPRVKQLIMVKGCASRLLDLVVNIMEMSAMIAEGKSEKHKRALSRDPVDLKKIIEEVLTMVENSCDKQGKSLVNKQVVLENEMSEMPIIQADAHKCTQVFYNIVTNACKFCRKGSIKVSSRVNEKKKNVEVMIADTGVGIAPEAMERIFKPFEQEDNTEQRTYEGIGLGLAISREVVQRHGGSIRVASSLGVGSTFTVQLPIVMKASGGSAVSSPYNSQDGASDEENLQRRTLLTKLPETIETVDDDESSPPVSPVSKESPVSRPVVLEASKQLCLPDEPKNGTRRPIVLSVDDDAVNQEVIRATLEKDYEVYPAMDGKECLDYFGTHSRLPDVVLLDVMMPGMNGYDVATSIRQDFKLSAAVLPIIMLSAKSPITTSITRGLACGCNDYAVKPFEKEVLQARVRTAVQIKRLHEIQMLNAKHTQLLYSIMPSHIIERLQAGETMISESHNSVTILFSDIVGWTNIAEALSTSQVVMLLNELFSAFDELTERHTVFKVETIGDAYMCAAGHDGSKDHADRMIQFGLAMVQATKKIKPPTGLRLQIRVGIHTGPAYTGVVGKKVPRYCFFGDTVNVASRMESHGVPGCIHVSQSTRTAMTKLTVANSSNVIERGSVDIKGKGLMATHIVVPEGAPMPILEKGAPKKRESICTFSAPGTLEQKQSSHQSVLEQKPNLQRSGTGNNMDATTAAELTLALNQIKELECASKDAKEAATKAEEDLAKAQQDAEEAATKAEEELAKSQQDMAKAQQEVRAAREAAAKAEASVAYERERTRRFEDENRELETLKTKLNAELSACKEAAMEQQERKIAQSQGGACASSITQTPRGTPEKSSSPGPHSTADSGDGPMEDGMMPSPRSVTDFTGSTTHALYSKLRNTSRLLHKSEVEMEHLRLELRHRDLHLQDMREQLATKTKELQAKKAEVEEKEHALLDLRLASGDWLGHRGRASASDSVAHSLPEEFSFLEGNSH